MARLPRLRRRINWSRSSRLPLLDDFLAVHRGGDAAVAVVSSDPQSRQVRRARRALTLRQPELRVVDVTPTPDLRVSLVAAGPLGGIVDLRGEGDPRERFRQLCFALDGRGAVLTGAPSHELAKLVRMLRRAERLREGGRFGPRLRDGRPRRTVDRAALADVLVAHRRRGPWLLAELDVQDGLRATLDEEQTNALLRAVAGARGTILREVSADAVPPGPGFRRHDPRSTARPASTVLAGRPLTTRCYRDVVCAPQSVVSSQRALLSETFRVQHGPRLRNAAVVDWSPGFGATGQALADPPTRLDGPVLHLDLEWRGHFGHTIVDQLPRLWDWKRIVETYPDVRVLVGERPGHPIQPWELSFLEAAGVEAHRLVLIDRPVLVGTLVTSTPAWRHPGAPHPILRGVYAEIGETLHAASSGSEASSRVFLTRRPPLKRTCINVEEVEQLFAAHSFQIVRPETLSLTEQIAVVRSADVVAGFAGSGMYHLAFASRPIEVITINSDTYTADVERHLASLWGHTLDVFFCRSLAPPRRSATHRAGRSSFKSDFWFDPTVDGRALQRRLERL